MAEEMDFELRLDDTVEEVEAQAPVEVEPQQVPMEMEVEPREAEVQEPGVVCCIILPISGSKAPENV